MLIPEFCHAATEAREKAAAHDQAINIATARKKGEKWAKKLK